MVKKLRNDYVTITTMSNVINPLTKPNDESL